MVNPKKLLLFFLLGGIISLSSLQAQNECKVLLNTIDSVYNGSCKNGLAHGKGEAVGADYYNGNFKKGLPNGFGVYVWADGARYEGNWKKGQRHGKGTFILNDSIVEGRWRNDRFLRAIPQVKYQVIQRRNLERFTLTKIGDGNRILFEIYRNGLPNRAISNLNIYGNTGEYINVADFLGYDNVNFPFRGKVDYLTPNKLGTVYYNVTFEFIINEPGVWQIRLYN